MRDPFTAMALAYPFPLPGYEPPQKPKHQPSYYLTDEAREKRLAKLAEKIAADPNSVPASVQRKVLSDLARIVGRATERKEAA